MKRAAAWACLALLLIIAGDQFGPDGSNDAGIPPEISPTVRKAIAKLRSRRPARRCNAAIELGRMRAPGAVPSLIPLLADGQQAMGPGEQLLQSVMFGGTSRTVRDCASTALGQLGSAATPDLIAALAGNDVRLRRSAAHLLALSPEPLAINAMAARLSDTDPALRRDALTAVVQNNQPEKSAALRHALVDPDPELRRLALTYTAGESEPWVFDAVLNAASDPDPAVSTLAVDRLGSSRDPRAIDVLIERLADADLSVRQNAHAGLRLLTRLDHGRDPARWRAWRQQQR